MEPKRNYLARVRTTMANERTLLSYYRSSVALLGFAAFIYKFLQSWATITLSILCVFFGLFLAYIGTRRFIKQRRKIERLKA